MSLEGVCVSAMVLHNMERGEFDFKETQTPDVGPGSQACVNPEELMGAEGRLWLVSLAPCSQGSSPPVALWDTPTLGMLLKAPRDPPFFTFSAVAF